MTTMLTTCKEAMMMYVLSRILYSTSPIARHRITASNTLVKKKGTTKRMASTLKTCTIKPNVCDFCSTTELYPIHVPHLAKKEETPEEALKEFRAIIDQEEEKGDWCGLQSSRSNQTTYIVHQGVQSTQTNDKTTVPWATQTKRRSKDIY